MYIFKPKTRSILLVFICNLSVTTTVTLATFIVVHFGDGGGGSGKPYLLYTCENVDNCEQPLIKKVSFVKPVA